MDSLLYKHGCENRFQLPEGLKELMSDITREVLRYQPGNIAGFIQNYLSCLLITREHSMVAKSILDDLCDCHPTISEELLALGMSKSDASLIAVNIQDEIKNNEPSPGSEKIVEREITKNVLVNLHLRKEMRKNIRCVIKKTYKGYWYRKKIMSQSIDIKPNEPWTLAAERTLKLFHSTQPSMTELERADEKIKAAYSSYHKLRPHTLRYLRRYLQQKPTDEALLVKGAGENSSSDEDLIGVIEPELRKIKTSCKNKITEEFIKDTKRAVVIKSKPPPFVGAILGDNALDDSMFHRGSVCLGSDPDLNLGYIEVPSPPPEYRIDESPKGSH